MSPKIIYKPRFNIAYVAKSKVWPYKDSYLRRFYTLRGRRVQRGGLFRRCVLVATTIKWTQARRFIRPEGRSSGSTKLALSSKTAYIFRLSPRSIKQRYRNLFYKKQLLRSFHGKLKEEAFRQFFRNRVKLVGTHTYSFYDNLESRLDIVFFRRRLLPTIYACHQFIHFHGLELNGNSVYSPRTQVRVGDMISIASSTWKAFNKHVFMRIYYRRWGMSILRRRLYKQIKKKMFFVRCMRNRRIKNNIIFFYKNYIKSKPFFKDILRKNKNVSHSFIKRLCSVIIINKTNRIKKQSIGIKIKSPLSSSYKKNSIHKNKAVIIKTKSFEKQNFVFQIKNFLEEIFQTSNKDTSYEIKDSFTSPIRVFRPFMQLPGIGDNFKKKSEYSVQIFIFSKILYKFITIFITIINKDRINNLKDSEKYKKNLLIFKKLHQFQKIAFSLRLYKTFLPIVKKFIKNKNYSKKQKYSKTYRQLQRRAKRLRFSVKRRKKKNRGLKNIRRKSVHFFIPAYLQMDFRTLRAVKVQSPNLEEIYYPFRISLPKRYSFYRSQGF